MVFADPFLIFLILVQFHKVLLETVQVEFGIVVNVVLKWIFHVHLTYLLGVVGQGGGEHHDLLLVLHLCIDGLHLLSHVDLIHHLVALIQDKHLQIIQN